jgi:S1-C subfamily serine protease
MFDKNSSYKLTVSSTYGFELSYDQREFYASAIDGSNGSLHLGTDLNREKPYTVVRIAPQYDSEQAAALGLGTALTITYHASKATSGDPLEAIALQDGGLDATNLSKLSSEDFTIDGKDFKKTSWQSKTASEIAADLKANFVTYTGVVQDHAITIVVSLGVDESNSSLFDALLASVKFGSNSTSGTVDPSVAVVNTEKSRDLLDLITNSTFAAAASSDSKAPSSEKIAALYAPAVVKVYHAYCMDISVNSTPFFSNACSAVSGSGFIVSQDGYIATNGHVASITPKELAIYNAMAFWYTKGNYTYLAYLLNMTSLLPSDIAGKTSEESMSAMVDALYDLSDSIFTASSDVDNILVNLSNKEIDGTALVQATMKRESYTEKHIVSAKLVGANYRLLDGFDGWRASDVALLKISGDDFPIVELGDIDDLQQGADLSILGYPGAASSNGLVESTTSEATLTTGKVSAKKKASGSDSMLVETDTTIGHGNSGGPAFDGSGKVIGIATYTIDGSGAGDGVYNYIRDIKDFTNLVDNKNVKLDTASATQTEWAEGINNFYTSHYSKAVKNFEKVQELYPDHSKAAEFIAAANKRIANGEDVVDFPWVIVLVASAVVLVGATVSVVLIVRHKKHHGIYKAGVAQGTVQPLQPGAPAQAVMVSQPIVQPSTGAVAQPATFGFGQAQPVVPPTPPVAPAQPAIAAPQPIPVQQPAPTPPPQSTPASNYYASPNPGEQPGNIAQ